MRFWAVTKTSVYSIFDGDDDQGVLVEKIKIRDGVESKIGLGYQKLCDYLLLGTILQFLSKKDVASRETLVNLQELNINRIPCGSGTSRVVALFAREQDALACFRSWYRQPGDPRWQRQTSEVLDLVGKDHPYIVVYEKGYFAIQFLSWWQWLIAPIK